MAKLTLSDLSSLENQSSAIATINANNTLIENALELTLSRDGTAPNIMVADLDMNSNQILNLPTPVATNDAVTKGYADSAYGNSLENAASAAASAVAATASQVASAASAAAAVVSANAASSSSSAATISAAAASSSATASAASAVTSASNATVVAGFKYNFESSTSMAAPATGGWRLNNATVASATAAAFDASSGDTGNPNARTYMLTWDDSTSTTKGYLILRKLGTPATFAIFSITSITDNTTWLQFTFSHISSSGSWSAADVASVTNNRTGDNGTGDFSSNTASSVDSEIVLFSGTAGKTGKRATTTGILKGASGVLSAATAGTDYMKADTTNNLTAGFTTTSVAVGTKSTGTFTPDPTLGNMQHYTNGGAHTIAPPSSVCTMVIECTNASAGALTTSGFSLVSGDTYSSTGTKKHLFRIAKTNSFSHLDIRYITGT